jgi:hypothetical protein
MTTAQQMEDLIQAKQDMIEALETKRAEHHEAGVKLQLGERRP